MKIVSKDIFKIIMVIGSIIVFLNLFYFFAFKDDFFNKNTMSGILIIIFSLYSNKKAK